MSEPTHETQRDIGASIRAAVVPELQRQADALGATLLHDFVPFLKSASDETLARITAHATRAAQFRLEAALETDPEKSAELLAASETAMRAVRVAVSAAGLVASERTAAVIESVLRKSASILAEAGAVAIRSAAVAAVAAL